MQRYTRVISRSKRSIEGWEVLAQCRRRSKIQRVKDMHIFRGRSTADRFDVCSPKDSMVAAS